MITKISFVDPNKAGSPTNIGELFATMVGGERIQRIVTVSVTDEIVTSHTALQYVTIIVYGFIHNKEITLLACLNLFHSV